MVRKKILQHNHGFTLLEILIATVVLAIALSGLYTVIKTNITTSDFIKKKIDLFSSGCELFYTLYTDEKEIEPTGTYLDYEGHPGIQYRIEKKPLGFFDIYEFTISLKKDGSELVYHFYK